jgi:2-haloacid dehalogenase
MPIDRPWPPILGEQAKDKARPLRFGGTIRTRPTVVGFDMIETVFSLESLRGRLEAAGLPGAALELWFAQTLRDALALDATDVYQPFNAVGSATLEGLFAERGIKPDSLRIREILQGFAELSAHPDAEQAFRTLRDAGIRIIALTNGSAENTRKLLQRAHLEGLVERTISAEEVRHWKPRREVYLHAAKTMGVDPQHLALVAAHAWDVHGAGRAGLTTGFVARGKPFPAIMVPPDFIGETLADVAAELVRLT